MRGESSADAISSFSTRPELKLSVLGQKRRFSETFPPDGLGDDSDVVGVVLAAFVTAASADLCTEGDNANHGENGEDRYEDHDKSLGGSDVAASHGRSDRPMISFMISVVPP